MKSDVNKNVQMNAAMYRDALPGKQSFSDIDLITERKGSILALEFFGHCSDEYPPTSFKGYGQLTLLAALNKKGVDVWLVAGQNQRTNVPGVFDCYPYFYNKLVRGKPTQWVRCDLDSFKVELANWNTQANL